MAVSLANQVDFWRTSYDLTRPFGQCDYPSPPPGNPGLQAGIAAMDFSMDFSM